MFTLIRIFSSTVCTKNICETVEPEGRADWMQLQEEHNTRWSVGSLVKKFEGRG